MASGIPIVASLNVTEAGAWLDFAKQVEEAGANALELNIYSIVGDIDCIAERVEQRTLAIIKLVKRMIKIPIAVKLYPFYTSLPNFVNQLAKAGADAVVLFTGGRGERLEAALELLDAGVGSALVLPNGNKPDWEAANELCSRPHAFDVFCFTPDPADTWGEARGIGALADDNGWSNVVAVTSTYHVTRVGTLLGRCTLADVEVVGADPNLSALEWTTRLGHEWVGAIAGQTIRRSC